MWFFFIKRFPTFPLPRKSFPFPFPFQWKSAFYSPSHGNPMGFPFPRGITFPCTSLLRILKVTLYEVIYSTADCIWQGSVATRWRRGGIFNITSKFTAEYIGERNLKIGQYLLQLWWAYFLLDHRVVYDDVDTVVTKTCDIIGIKIRHDSISDVRIRVIWIHRDLIRVLRWRSQRNVHYA